MDAIEAELQHLIAVEQGDTDRASLIRHEWDMAQYAQARRARKGRVLAACASVVLWAAAIALPVYLISQIIK